jgi:hypothetical protein
MGYPPKNLAASIHSTALNDRSGAFSLICGTAPTGRKQEFTQAREVTKLSSGGKASSFDCFKSSNFQRHRPL